VSRVKTATPVRTSSRNVILPGAHTHTRYTLRSLCITVDSLCYPYLISREVSITSRNRREIDRRTVSAFRFRATTRLSFGISGDKSERCYSMGRWGRGGRRRHGACMVLEIVDIFLYNYTHIARGLQPPAGEREQREIRPDPHGAFFSRRKRERERERRREAWEVVEGKSTIVLYFGVAASRDGEWIGKCARESSLVMLRMCRGHCTLFCKCEYIYLYL